MKAFGIVRSGNLSDDSCKIFHGAYPPTALSHAAMHMWYVFRGLDAAADPQLSAARR